MAFQNILSRNTAAEVLEKAVAGGRMHHAYLLSGPEGSGKTALAVEAAMALFCRGDEKPCRACTACLKLSHYNHPDLRVLFPFVSAEGFKDAAAQASLREMLEEETGEKQTWDDLYVRAFSAYAAELVQKPYLRPALERGFQDKNREITIHQVRELMDGLAMPPSESEVKVVIIVEADRMNPTTANALLKTLEEPPAYVRFFLVTARPHALLPTIRSRCQELKFAGLADADLAGFLTRTMGAEPARAAFAARFAQGSIHNALAFLDAEDDAFKQEALDLLECIADKDLPRALALADAFSGSTLSENRRRLVLAATFARETEAALRGDQGGLPEEFVTRLSGLCKKFRPGDYPRMLGKVSAAVEAFEKKSQPRHVYAAFFAGLIP